jgi:hypothetical protein
MAVAAESKNKSSIVRPFQSSLPKAELDSANVSHWHVFMAAAYSYQRRFTTLPSALL